MENSNKGFITPILIALSIVVIGAGATYYVWHKNVKQAIVNQPTATSTQDCGTVINTSPNSGTSTPQAIKNNASYICMSNAIVACSPATLTVPIPQQFTSLTPIKDPSVIEWHNETFKIMGKQGDYCLVQRMSPTVSNQMTCSIPNDFISGVAEVFQTKKATSYIFPAMQFAFSPSSTPVTRKAQAQNPKTKEIVHIQCTDATGATWFGTK